MKNGHCMDRPSRRPNGSRVRTTSTAIGTAMTRVSTVVSTAKIAVLTMTCPNPASVNRCT